MRTNQKLFVESASLGVGYAAFLVWVGSAFVGSFGDFDDAYPYWPDIPRLRTDTAGALGFALAAVTLVISRYLQLRRRAAARAQEPAQGQAPGPAAERSAGVLTVLAVADVAAVLATATVIYLSCNAAMHPWSLPVQLTHLWMNGPSEGTVRVISLLICLVAVAVRRYLGAAAGPVTRRPAPVPEKADYLT